MLEIICLTFKIKCTAKYINNGNDVTSQLYDINLKAAINKFNITSISNRIITYVIHVIHLTNILVFLHSENINFSQNVRSV